MLLWQWFWDGFRWNDPCGNGFGIGLGRVFVKGLLWQWFWNGFR